MHADENLACALKKLGGMNALFPTQNVNKVTIG